MENMETVFDSTVRVPSLPNSTSEFEAEIILPLLMVVFPTTDRRPEDPEIWVQLFYKNPNPRPSDPDEAADYEDWLHAELVGWDMDDMSLSYRYRIPGFLVFLEYYPDTEVVSTGTHPWG